MKGPFSGSPNHSKITMISLSLVMILIMTFVSCAKEQESQPYRIAVFVPGIVSGSPIYEMLVAGAQQAADEHEQAVVQVIEGGSNQGLWEESISTLAASQEHDLIVTSNPAMPAIAAAVSAKFPEQRFAIMDGALEGNEAIYTLRYDQQQQAMLAGHLAGLITASSMSGANDQLKIGLIAGQEYPDMTDLILPGFTAGAQTAHASVTVEFRVVGNWYDAAKGSELARAMIADGVDVILPIAGGANQGVLTAAADAGTYVLWYDTNGYALQKGTVAGSTAIRQDKATYETVVKAIEGTLPFGSAETVGLERGYITFIEDDELYLEIVPQDIRDQQHAFIESMMK
jgi:riboflavin transport system substrate-binding protein